MRVVEILFESISKIPKLAASPCHIMFRKEHVLNYIAIILMALITISEVSLLLSDEQAEETKEERELKEELKEKEGEKEFVLLPGCLDLSAVTPFTFQFLAKTVDSDLIKQPKTGYMGQSLFIVFCSLKIPFC